MLVDFLRNIFVLLLTDTFEFFVKLCLCTSFGSLEKIILCGRSAHIQSHLVKDIKTNLSLMPVGQLLIEQLVFSGLDGLADALPTRADALRIVPSAALFDQTFDNSLVRVASLFHVHNDFILGIIIWYDASRDWSAAAGELGLLFRLLGCDDITDFIDSGAFLGRIELGKVE